MGMHDPLGRCNITAAEVEGANRKGLSELYTSERLRQERESFMGA